MAASRNVAVFALLLICFAVAPSTQKFTLHVDEVYPNFGPTVEILELNSGFMDTAELDVSTLRVQSSEGVTITTPGGITLDGASFSSTAGSVSISTTSSNSEINIIGANALDFFGNTVDFSSSNGNIDLHAEADMQFVGLGTFDAQVDNFNSIGDNIAVSAAAGSISFSMGDDFNAAGGLFSADGINGLSVLAAETLTLQSVFNNLDVNGNTVALSGNTLAVNADRNNVVLAASSTLSGAFDDIAVDGADGVYIVSMESSFTSTGDDITLTATNGDLTSTALFEAYFEGADATFTSTTAGTRFVASSGMLAKLSDEIAFTAANNLALTAVENFSAHSSAGDVSAQANSALTFDGDGAFFGSAGSSSFVANDEVTINGFAGMYITAAQSIVYGSQLPASVLFPISVTGDDVRMGGATVSATVDSLNLTGTSDDDVIFRTSDLSRDSTIQMVASGALSIEANTDIDLDGGFVSVVATGDLTMNAFTDIDMITGPRAFGSQFTVSAGNNFAGSASDNFEFESGKDMLFTIEQLADFSTVDTANFDAQRNLLLRAEGSFALDSDQLTMIAEDQARFFSDADDVTFTAVSQATLDSRGIVVLRADGVIDTNADDIDINAGIANFHGVTVQFDADDIDLNSDDGVIAFAGDNEVDATDFTADAQFMAINSPPGQDITFTGDTVTIAVDDVAISGNIVVFDVDDFDVQAENILFQSGDQKPILIDAGDLTSTSTTILIRSSDDVTFSTPTLTMPVDAVSLTAINDIKTDVSGTFTFTMGSSIGLTALDVSFATDGTHTNTVTGTSGFQAETMAFESSSGNIDSTVGGTFTFDSSLAGFASTVVSMTATDGVSLSAVQTATATGNADWLQFGDLVEITSAIDTSFLAFGDITFLGSTIDHTSASLTTASVADTNVFGRDVVMNAATTMDFTVTGDILIDGDSVILSHTGNTGTVTTNVSGDAEFLSNGRLNLFSGGDFYLSSALASNPPTERSIIITASARSAGISVASLNANMEADGSIVFMSTDYATGHPGTSGGVGTNSGGFDVNVLAANTATYTSDFINSATSGVRMLSEGAAYDKKLAINTGALFRSLSTGNIQLTSQSRAVNLMAGDSVTFEAELGAASIVTSGTDANTISTANGDVVYENLGGDISFATVTSGSATVVAAGYGTMQSGAQGQTADAGDSLVVSVAGDFDLQADRGRISLSQTGLASMSITAFNALIEGAADFNWDLSGALLATTVGSATNCEGGNTVSADCNDITIFGDTGASFTASAAAFSINLSAGTDVLIESSLNNDVTFLVDNSGITATAAATITGGHNAEFNGGDMQVNANDILFTTQGSHWIAAEGDVAFNSVADQRFEADHSLVVESISGVTVNGPAIASIYAGGLGRPYGIEVNAEDADFQSDQDIAVASESYRSLSITDTTVTADSSMTIHSLGTPNLGNDIFFESAEDIVVDADTQFLMTASNILMEFDTSLTFEGDIFMSSQRAITWTSERTTSFDGEVDISADDVSFVSFLRDPVDSVTGDSTSATGNVHAQFWSATGDVSMQSADDMTWLADGIATISAGGDIDFFTANSNSDISFETLGKLSDIHVTTGGDFDSASTRVDFVAVHSATFGSPSTVDILIGDSATSTAEGNIIMSSGFTASVTAAGDIEMTSTGRMITATSGEGADSFLAGEDMLFDADKDIVFEFPHRFSSASSAQQISFAFDDEIDMLFGADFRYSAGGDVFFGSAVMDISVNGVFQDNNDGLAAGDQPFGFRVTAVDSDVFGQATGSATVFADAIELTAFVDINVDAADSLITSDLIHVEAHGPDGITVSTSESATHVVMISDELTIVGDDFVNFVAFGAETGVGNVNIEALGTISPNALGYDFVQQPALGVGIVSDQGDVTFNSQQGGISHAIINDFNNYGPNGSGHNNTASYYMNPGVNGTLTIASYGSDAEGLGFSASASGTYLVSEHNIVLEGQNVRFEELGQDPYYAANLYAYANQNQDFYDLQQSRAVVYGYAEQDWTAAGANENGNGIEVVSSVPFKGVRMQSYFVGLSAGGSLRMEAAEELSFITENQFIAESESSVIIEAHASSDEEVGILIAVVDEYYNGVQNPGHVQFHAEEDLLLDAAGRLLLESDSEMTFSSGPTSNVNFNPDSGFFLDTASTSMSVAGSMTFRAAQDIVFSSDNGISITGTTSINIVGSNADDSNSDVIFGNPDLDSGTLSVYGGVDDLTGNVLFDTNSLIINAAVFDIAQTAGLILPEELNFAGCGSQLPGSTFIRYVGTAASLCYCNNVNGDFVEFPFNTIS